MEKLMQAKGLNSGTVYSHSSFTKGLLVECVAHTQQQVL